jgi:hypothetical protein
MAKNTESTEKVADTESTEKVVNTESATFCLLRSKANYQITVLNKSNNTPLFIPAFGKIKVIKEQITFNSFFD